MKKRLLTTAWLMLLTSVFVIRAMAQTVTVQVNTAGGLWDALEAQGVTNFSAIKNLKVTGVIGDSDFQLIKNQMSQLEILDVSGTNVTKVPNRAFYGKETLKTVRLPEGITNINYEAFSGCQLLESVTFGNKAAVTGKIVFPASLRIVDTNAFYNCKKLTHLDFSACTSLETLGSSAFANLFNLQEVLFPSQGNLRLEWSCFNVDQSWDETTQQWIYKGLENLTLTQAVTYLSGYCLPRTLKTLYVESATPPTCQEETFKNILETDNLSLKVYIAKGSKRSYAIADGWGSLYQYMEEMGFQVNISGYGALQLGNRTYLNGNVFFANQNAATTLKVVPEGDNELISVTLNGSAVNVASDGTFTIPAGNTTGTLDIVFTSKAFTIDNPNGGELRDLIAASGKSASSITTLRVTGTLAAKDWNFIKNNLTALEEFDISETDVKSVPEEVFSNKGSLTTVHLPSTVTIIGSNAFYYCEKLNIIDGCDNVTTIGSSAFASCSTLSVFPFGNAIWEIGSSAFENCTSLPASLVMPASLTSINNYVFNGSSVRSFDLSQCTFKDTNISYNAFGKCTYLLLPEKGNYTLSWNALGDAQLTELRLPAVVSSIWGDGIFPTTLERLYVSTIQPISAESRSFTNLDLDNCTLYVPIGSKETYEDATGWSGFSNIKESGFKVDISGYGTVQQGSITYGNGDVFFANQGAATTLTAIPETGCELISVTLDNNTLDVDADGNFTIPAGSTVGTLNVAFTANPFTIANPNGGELKDLITASGRSINSINVLKVTGKMTAKDWSYVRGSLTALKEFDIRETDVKTIPSQAFQDHQNITIVHLPSTVTIIGSNAYSNCQKLTTIDGCENVKEIEYSAFRSCSKLSVFPFGDKIQKIDYDAFNGCSSLPASLVMPASLTTLGWSNVFTESSVRSFDLSQCTLTGGFAYNTFGSCTSLLLPEKGDYQMGYEALKDAQLTELRLPAALSSIYGEKVLPTTLERLYVSRSTPFDVNDNSSFSNIDFDNCTLYVPIGSTKAYADAPKWSDFTKVKEYGLQVTIGEEGKVRVSGQTLMGTTTFFPSGSTVLFEIIPNEGWHANAVKLDGVDIPFADNKFTLNSNQLNGKLTVTFAVNQYKLDLQISGNGKVKLGSLEYTTNQTLTVDNLSTLNFTLEPAEGQVVSAIVFNGQESVVQNGGTTYVTPAITANSTLAITFGTAGASGDVATYTVTTSEGGTVEYKNTTLLPETTIQLPKGQPAVLAMKPDQYYVVDAVTLNGNTVTAQLDDAGQLTIENVSDDATLEVTFRVNAELTVVMEDAGNLKNMLSATQKQNATKLTISGPLSEQDFYTMRDEMPQLSVLDLWKAQVEYFPSQAFCTSTSWSGTSVGKKSLTSVRLPEMTRWISDFAFAGCTNLKEVNFTELKNLENIYSNAFENTNLQVIDLSQTKMTEVGDAFRGVKNLENIKFPQTITKLYGVFYQSTISEIDLSAYTNLKTLDGTFYNCKNLVKVTLPEGLTSITSNAFGNCEALTTFNFPKSLQMIGYSAFAYTKIQKVDLSGLTELQSIGEYAFNNCQELTEVLIPASLEQLGNSAFSSCRKLTSIDLSKTKLTTIPERAFGSCEALESFKLPKTLETIDSYAFAWNNKLGGVLELGAGFTSLGEYAFNGTQISIIKSEATVPPTLKENTMSDAWIAAFVPEGCANAYKDAAVWGDKVILDKELHAEVTVTREGNLAVDINEQVGIAPATITHLKVNGKLGVQDFAIMRSNMTLLYDLDMEDADVTIIPDNAFLDKKVLMNVKLPQSLLRIEQGAFRGCSSLKGQLTLPTGLKFIGYGAFQGCTSLEEVVINENLTVIQGYAFEGCSTLAQEITLPRNFQSLGESAFANCSSLYGTVKFNRDFDMFMGTEGYGSSAGSSFENCSKIEKIDMSEPDFLDEIPFHTFAGCTSLKTVILPPYLERIDDGAFANCSSLDGIEFPTSMKVINYYAFQNCTSLSSIDLSDCKNLGTLEGYAFNNCSNLETVYLPKSMNWIRDYVFGDCRKLANITVEALTPADLGEYVFHHVHTDRCVLSIPTGTFEDYLSAAQWGAFVSMRKNIDVTVGEGANLYFYNNGADAARGANRAAATEQQGSKVKDGSSLYVQENETATFKVNPEENVVIEKVLYNGEDVTAQMVDGTYQTPNVTKASSFEVQVKVVGDIHVKELRMLDDEVAVKKGENRQLRFAVYPTNATNKSIEWTSSNNDVATVNSEGIISGVAPGRAEITAKSVDNPELEQKCEIVVMSNDYWIVMENTVEEYVENTIQIPLALHNEGEARDIQFDVYMPDGINMNDAYGDFGIQLSGRASAHQVSAARLMDGGVRVIVYSLGGSQFQETDGDLLLLPFTTGEETGSFDVTIKNIHISGPNNFDFAAPDHTIHFNLKDYPLGDSNGDGDITINDAVHTVDNILQYYQDRFIKKAADVNKDNQITVADVTATVDIILERPSASRATGNIANDAQGRLYMNQVVTTSGDQQTISMKMENASNFIALQCDVYLPEAMKIALDENDKPIVSLAGGVNGTHSISSRLLDNGALRVIVFSPQNEHFNVAENNIINLAITTDGMAEGEMVDIRDIRLVRADNSEYLAPDESTAMTFKGATGIDNVLNAEGMALRADGHYLIINAAEDGNLQVVSMSGITKNIKVHTGENRLYIEQPGVYIICGKKVLIK